jgi:hypothetical protein
MIPPSVVSFSCRHPRHLRVDRLGGRRHVGNRHPEIHDCGVVDPRETGERLDRVAQHLDRDMGADRQRRLLQPLTRFGPKGIGPGQPLAV